MLWRLSEGAYWRFDGDDILVAVPGGVLRLNAAGAGLFLSLLRGEDLAWASPADISAVTGSLGEAGVLVTTETWSDPDDKCVNHLAR